MFSVSAAFLAAALAGGFDESTVTLKPLSTGAMSKMGGYRPQRLTLNADKPDTLRKVPEDVSAPMYGVLAIGVADEKGGRTFHVLLDEPAGKDARLWVDTNGNGDLTDDAPAEWKGRSTKGQDGKDYTQYNGGAMLDLKYDDQSFPAHVSMYRFDKTDPRRASMKDVVMFYADYAYEGEVQFGSKQIKAMLVDDAATGDFRGKDAEDAKGSGVRLLLDVNANGKFEARGEAYDIRQPFNLGGTTYQIVDMSPSGAKFRLVKSDKPVAEIPPPPDHGVGKVVTAFNAETTDGKKISFPSSYRGKIVMIDFWATWCGPCMEEVPNLVAVYDDLHGKGFEILGITLDQENALDKVKKVTGESKMTWPQVYDGGGWKAQIAQLFVINSIPAALLVDGDTGEILATTSMLRGERLKATIQKALDKKRGDVKG